MLASNLGVEGVFRVGSFSELDALFLVFDCFVFACVGETLFV